MTINIYFHENNSQPDLFLEKEGSRKTGN